jgi:dinuclear metal center YbgI/SA1388 family protein
MQAKVSDLIKIVEKIAPPMLAEKWDNPGLQVGKSDWPVKTAWIALDPTPDVIAAACRSKADILITHHPLIFNPLKCIDFGSSVGKLIHLAAVNRLSIFSAHTNLDSAENGINDLLASLIGLKNTRILCGSESSGKCKFVVYVPAGYEKRILEALFETNAGTIGSYTCCSFRNSGKGTFRPGSSAKPFTGKRGRISDLDEIRIEAVAVKQEIPGIIAHIRKSHPYETMAYDVYPLYECEDSEGLGRVGKVGEEMTLRLFALKIKDKLSLKSIRLVGNPELSVTHAAVCSGSGSSLMKDFLKSEAQVYITGDIRYHDARTVEAEGKGLIDIGHFASEHIAVADLARRIKALIRKAGYDVSVKACGMERDPFYIL